MDVAELLVALPGQGDYVVRVPEGELRIQSGGLFLIEMFGTDLQGPTDPVERIALAPAVPEGLLRNGSSAAVLIPAVNPVPRSLSQSAYAVPDRPGTSRADKRSGGAECALGSFLQ